MENIIDKSPATPEKIWELLMENARQMAESRAEYEKSCAEYERRSAEYEKRSAESRAEYERYSADVSRKIREISDMIGGVSNSNGMFAEEFFLNAIDLGDKKLFGEQFHECISYARRHNKALRLKIENDLILVNGDSVALIEIKYKARKEDVQKMIDILPRFRALYPEYKNHRIYLGLAAMSFEKGVEKECIEKGVAIVKQVGNAVVLDDEHVKAF